MFECVIKNTNSSYLNRDITQYKQNRVHHIKIRISKNHMDQSQHISTMHKTIPILINLNILI